MRKVETRFPLRLQFFAVEGEGSTEAAPDLAEIKAGDAQKPDAPPKLSELLGKDPALQSQFDKMVAKSLETARGKWEREKSMSAEELAEQKAVERLRELEKREQAVLNRELRAQALSLMGERGLPQELIAGVNLADEDTMKDSLEAVEDAFRRSLDMAVRERMRGTPPKSNGSDPQNLHLAVMRQRMGLR